MFEKLIEGIILQYFGEYIDNLDRNKLQVGLLSGYLVMEDVKVKPKAVNDFKLPFELTHGIFGKLTVQIPWKSNFSSPTIIDVENVDIVLNFISPSNWEFIDYYSYDVKLKYLETFFTSKITELKEALNAKNKKPIRSDTYLTRLQMKIIDNLHINFKNIHIRLEDNINKPFSSMGFTLEEILIVNTNENWEETFINRTDVSFTNSKVYKLLKIKQFGFYLDVNTTTTTTKTQINVDEVIIPTITDEMYLIKPVSVIGKMEQIVNNLTDNLKDETTAKMLITIHLDKLKLDLNKNQYDKIVNILNHISLYQRFQYCKYDSQKYNYYKRLYFNSCGFNVYNKDTYMTWWKYAIKMVMKRNKMYLGNCDEFKMNSNVYEYYKEQFNELFYQVVECNCGYTKDKKISDMLNKDNEMMLRKIIEVVDLNVLYTWEIDIVQKYFKKTNIANSLNPANAQRAFFMSFFGQSSSSSNNNNSSSTAASSTVASQQNLLSKEEEAKIEEIFIQLKEDINTELKLSEKYIKFKVVFTLNEGSITFTSLSSSSVISSESFTFIFKSLYIIVSKSEISTYIETTLSEFNINMNTTLSKNNTKTIKITTSSSSSPSNIASPNNDYIWKLQLRLNDPKSSENSSLNFHIKTFNILYHQRFIECIISFFVIKSFTISDDLMNYAYETVTEIKTKTSEQIKHAISNHIIVNITIDKRTINLPINKYNMKQSKYFIADIGSISISNACNHSIYVMNFNTVNLFYNSDNTLHNAFQIINNLKFELTIEVNKDKTIMLALFINNAITVNLSDEVYYVLMCIKDILQPITHHNDYYDIIEDNIMDIKKNCKIVSKVNKKSNLDVTEIYYKECFSVISGGYIYFFDKVDDEYFSSYFYIKNAVISIIDSNDKGEINIQGKYDNINLQFGSKQKMEKFLKILRERINEINIFANDNNNNNVIKESDNDNVIDPLKVVMKMNVNVCALNILLFSNKDMRDPYLNLNNTNNVVLNHIYTFKINEMCLTLTTHPYDYIFSFSIGDIELLDEAFNKPSSPSSHNNNLYQLLTSKETTQNTLNAVPNNNNNKNILNVDVMLINPKSPLYKNSSIVVNITIGYLYCIWNPYSIRKLLFFIIHNDIFKQEIKRSCMSITPSMQISNSSTMNTLLSQYTLNEDNNIKPTCNSNNNTLTLLLNASFSKLHVIWLQPVTCEYFIEILLGHSTLHVEMTIDHFTINGILGNVTMYDLSNYANNTLHNNPSTSTHKTTILSFQSDSSLTVNFTSYSYNCPLLQNNYTSTCLVVFNSVRLNFIHEHFFRCFHYIFDEFLNSLQIPPLIRKFRNANNKIPLIVSLSSFEFTKIEVMFKNPQIQIKPYDNCNDYFLIDLGIINVHNTYNKVKGKIRQAKEEERYMVTYTFKLENMNITSTFNNNTFVDNTDGVVLLKLTSFMNNEDNFYNDDILDKSFTIDIVLDKDVKVNLTQSEFGYLLKTMDWNVLFRDGNEKIYEYKQHYITYFNVEKQSLFESNSNSDITINNNDNEVNINVNNYIAFNINVNIKCLTLKLYDNYYKEHFLSFTLSNTYINFINKLNKQIELYINFQNVKAIAMKSQLLFEYKQQEADDDVNNKNKTQFTIRIVSDPDKDKNLILKVTNLKFIINIAMFNLIKTFFMEIPPHEQPLMLNNNSNNNSSSGNSSSSGNIESKPSFRINLDIKNILICLPTSNDECFCLSTDLFLLYKTARIDQAKRELVNTFNLLTWKLNNESNVYIKQQLEKELSNNTKEISHLNISFYDISPFTSTISQLTFNQSHMNSGINNNTKRFLTKFNFNFISSTSMQFRHPNNFILGSHSNISIKQLLCKVAYTDVIVLINAINHNFNTHISSFSLTNTNSNANTSSDNNNTSYKVQKMNESLIQLNATNNSSSSNITEKLINKGMGIDEIECDIIQITLIDNHSHTFFPFLSLVLKHIKLIKENYNIKQNTINIEFVCKVIIYNYYAGEWEPLLESTKVLIDKTTDNTYTNMNITSHHFNININNDLNINISDLSIAFLYSTFKLWYHNFTSLLLQNKTQLINQHTNSKVSNHRVINLSGRTMTVYETTTVNSANSVDKKQLCVLRNGEYYDIEYQEDAFIERKKKKKLSNTTNNSVNSSSSSSTTTSSIRNDKAISIHFDDISIGANTILIDNITTKKYKINTTLLKQQYNTHNELSQFEYLMSEVKITNLKKTITICSPLIFHNQLSKTLYVNLSKKNYTTTSTLKPNETLAIGYEYFDGNISFKIGNDDEQERGCDVRTFLDKEFTNYEMRFDDTRICFFNLKKKMKYVIAIVICSPVVVDNCLPLNIEFVIKGNKICVGKGEKEHVDNISLYNELVCERGEFVVGRYVNKGKVVFYDSSNSNSNNSSSSKNGSNGDKKRKDVVTKYIDMCYREDESGNSSSSDINILVTLINSQYKDSNVRIIFHCSGLIYNNTNLPIYAIPSDNNSSSNAVSNTNTNKNENIHILSYQQNNLTFAFTKPNTNTLYSSNTVSLNTIGIITSLTFLPNNNNNSSSLSSLNHEFILENTFSPITQDPTINILTNIITIHPKYILCNKTTYPFYYFIPFSMENFSDISPQNSNELCPGLLQPYTSQTVFFSNDFKHKIRLRPIEEQCTYQSGSKWNWSGLINVYYDNIITVQFEGKGEKKYFNIEKKVKQYTTYVIIDETTLHNSKYVIINETENIILNAYEPSNKAMSNEVILPQCNAVFGWNSNMSTKTMKVELLLVHNNKSISDKCKYSVADVKEFEFRDNNNNNTSNNSSNSSNDDKIYINGKECSFPVCEIISLTKTNNNNNIHNVNSSSSSSSSSSDIKIKFEISTNGMRKVIKISPYTSTSASPFETNIPTHTTTYEFTTKINQLGINIITDNRYLISSHKHNYTRNELAFISFKHIHTYYKSERFINSTAYNVDMQCKIKYIQIDNMQHYITQYPIILHMIPNDIVNNSGSSSSSSSNDDNNNRETHPFFNIAASYSKGDVKQNEPIKFTYFSYLIQAFYINIDNEIFEGVVGFINSITQQLNTSINKVHPILRKNTTTINSSSNTCNNNVLYLEPEWLNNNNIISNSSNIFFTHFESSSIEMILSFKASSALEQFLTSNPLFTKVLSSLSNIEHSHLLLNGSFMNNLYISYPNLINLILNQYKQHFLTKLLTIVGSIEILGNPLNLFRSLSIGVKDFVTKPIEGIVRGPLDGVEGAIQGGYSLIKHTINGAFSYTSNIASGISKSILHLSQDDTYIKAIEKEKIETQPKNFVFGLGYGISSLCNGVFSGICDAVIKPIEETQKKGITGLGTGIVKGIGGLFSKPVVGVLQLVSNTSDGIKNTFQTYNDDECGYAMKCKQIRRKRPFYGKFKCIKKYNVVHAKLLEFVVMEIEVFKNAKRKIDFVDVETYRNVKGEDNIVLFLTKSIVFVDVIRRCVKEEIPFTVINKAEVDKRKESVCIYFNKEFKGKIQAEVYLKKGDCEEGDSIAKKVNAYVKQ